MSNRAFAAALSARLICTVCISQLLYILRKRLVIR